MGRGYHQGNDQSVLHNICHSSYTIAQAGGDCLKSCGHNAAGSPPCSVASIRVSGYFALPFITDRESSSMYNLLRSHILKRIDLTEGEFETCTTFFVPKRIRRHQFLLHEREVCKHYAFVNRGLLRAYLIDEKGAEHVLQFAIEDWWISDPNSFLTGNPATSNIDALEDSELLLLERSAYEKLLGAIPKFEKLFRVLLEQRHAAQQRRISAALSLSAEEQYLRLLQTHPTIFQRVPLNQIASYLGITPQSLSRIRKKLGEKQG